MPKERVYGQIKYGRIAIRSVIWPHDIWDSCKDNPINRIKIKLRIWKINNSKENDERSIRLRQYLINKNVDTSTLSPVSSNLVTPRFVDERNREISV